MKGKQMETLVAFKNDAKLKKAMLTEVEKHRKADQILQGTYGKENGTWKGCAVACSLRSLAIIKKEPLVTSYNQHARYEVDLGIPEWLARLEDAIFEGLPIKDAMKWPGQFLKAIPVGVNLNPVKWQFGAYLMKENIDRVMKLKISDELKEQVLKALNGVLVLHEEAIKTGVWDESAAWSAARSAESAAWSAARSARSAAESAAWSARSAAESAARSAESAARSAAWSARSAAESAAWSAARSAAESAAESAAWSAWSAAMKKHSVYLLKLLEKAK